MLHNEEQGIKEQEHMIKHHLLARGITDERVIAAFRQVPRQRFVLLQDQEIAYEDYPLPIGYGQTISQPYIVAFMAQALKLEPNDRVLEIGTGSGYAAAIMSCLAGTVYSLEVVKELYDRASRILKQLHYNNVICYLRDGKEGLREEAPFDKIILTAAPEKVPSALIDQLKVGGMLIAPVGPVKLFQQLILYEKKSNGRIKATELMGVSFVELT